MDIYITLDDVKQSVLDTIDICYRLSLPLNKDILRHEIYLFRISDFCCYVALMCIEISRKKLGITSIDQDPEGLKAIVAKYDWESESQVLAKISIRKRPEILEHRGKDRKLLRFCVEGRTKNEWNQSLTYKIVIDYLRSLGVNYSLTDMYPALNLFISLARKDLSIEDIRKKINNEIHRSQLRQ